MAVRVNIEGRLCVNFVKKDSENYLSVPLPSTSSVSVGSQGVSAGIVPCFRSRRELLPSRLEPALVRARTRRGLRRGGRREERMVEARAPAHSRSDCPNAGAEKLLMRKMEFLITK